MKILYIHEQWAYTSNWVSVCLKQLDSKKTRFFKSKPFLYTIEIGVVKCTVKMLTAYSTVDYMLGVKIINEVYANFHTSFCNLENKTQINILKLARGLFDNFYKHLILTICKQNVATHFACKAHSKKFET